MSMQSTTGVYQGNDPYFHDDNEICFQPNYANAAMYAVSQSQEEESELPYDANPEDAEWYGQEES